VSAIIFTHQYLINTTFTALHLYDCEFIKCQTVSDKFNLHHTKGKYFKCNPIYIYNLKKYKKNKKREEEEEQKKMKKKKKVVNDILRPNTIIFVGI
jgi:hypothetical protein